MINRRDFVRCGLAGALSAGWSTGAVVATEPDDDDRSTSPKGKFFRLQEINGTWFLLDPQGRPFFLRGANHFGDGTYMPWNLESRYGSKQRWRQSVRDRHRELGFNYLPPSIGPSAVDPEVARRQTGQADPPRNSLVKRTPEWPAAHLAELDFPFTLFLEVPKQYMAGANMPDVFGDEFAAAVETRCQEMVAPLKDNPNLIGYHFCHNPPWNMDARSAAGWIADCTRPGNAGRKVWIQLMRRIYGSVERWRRTYGVPIKSWEDIESLDNPIKGYVSAARQREDQEAYQRLICDRWHQVYCETIRRYDPNHLILGDRNTLHLQPPPRPWAFHIMRRHLDVLSVNVMGPPETVYEVLEYATRHWNGPIHLADTGACIYEQEPAKSGYQAADLAEWEAVYRGMMEMGLEHPQIIGFGWCGYYETPPPSHRGGLIDCRTDEPLPERAAIVRKWNAWMAQQYAELYRSTCR